MKNAAQDAKMAIVTEIQAETTIAYALQVTKAPAVVIWSVSQAQLALIRQIEERLRYPSFKRAIT